ncbi:hypothetical protein CFOL_v3_21077, partial [Cephalotus follicularis]
PPNPIPENLNWHHLGLKLAGSFFLLKQKRHLSIPLNSFSSLSLCKRTRSKRSSTRFLSLYVECLFSLSSPATPTSHRQPQHLQVHQTTGVSKYVSVSRGH